MAQSRICGERSLSRNGGWNAARWGDHASYNVAKKVLEFEYQEEIPRSRLRAAYGDGFKGAPLRCQLSGEGLFPQDAGTCDGTATQVPSISSQENPVGGAFTACLNPVALLSSIFRMLTPVSSRR